MRIWSKIHRLERRVRLRGCVACAGAGGSPVIALAIGVKVSRRLYVCERCGAAPSGVRIIRFPRGSRHPYPPRGAAA
jgi:hypothetical protein